MPLRCAPRAGWGWRSCLGQAGPRRDHNLAVDVASGLASAPPVARTPSEALGPAALAPAIACECWGDTADGDDFSEVARRALGGLSAKCGRQGLLSMAAGWGGRRPSEVFRACGKPVLQFTDFTSCRVPGGNPNRRSRRTCRGGWPDPEQPRQEGDSGEGPRVRRVPMRGKSGRRSPPPVFLIGALCHGILGHVGI